MPKRQEINLDAVEKVAIADFNGMPIFISTGNPDPHVPLERVNESVRILKELHADVHLKVYDGRPHTVSQDELDWANKLIFR
ncbi:MAG: hypothetical protein KGY70_20385 [Bacteroidales bacterium]|nr:hypothetical protein [Bacteroidales bacterium]